MSGTGSPPSLQPERLFLLPPILAVLAVGVKGLRVRELGAIHAVGRLNALRVLRHRPDEVAREQVRAGDDEGEREPTRIVDPRAVPQMGSRDLREQSRTAVGGRLERAFANFRESFPLFAVAVLVAYLGGRFGVVTAIGAGLYVGGRIAFLPLYALGVPWVRSIAWGLSLTGILLTLLALVV